MTSAMKPNELVTEIERLVALDARLIDSSVGATAYGAQLVDRFADACRRAYHDHDPDPDSEHEVQHCLNKIYQLFVTTPSPGKRTAESSSLLNSIRNVIEDAFLASEDRAIPHDLLSDFPTTPVAYREWLCEIIHAHPAHTHPLYNDYLAEHGTAEDLRYLLAQESAIDGSTDDFLALAQVGFKGRPKMEIAANYWDEMGNGCPTKVHTFLFEKALQSFGISLSNPECALETEALICGNLQLMISLRREHAYKAIGYFAVSEYMTPARFMVLMKAWRRNGLDLDGAAYHLVHIDIDQDHAERWFAEVVGPVVESNRAAIPEITWGAICRLNTSCRYLDALFPRFPSRSQARTSHRNADHSS